MRRRTFLAATALSASAAAGCLGDGNGDGGGGTGTPAEPGTPPTSDGGTPTAMDVDPASFERIEVEGEQVPLAPVEVTHNWYARGAARFADARGQGQYDEAHITGSVWSPAPDGRAGEDPIGDWPADERIVCYCGCPHHLSSLRAATLIANGYEAVYVIDEGFFEWVDRGFPITGSAVDTEAAVIRGRSDAVHAGEPVYATQVGSDQREAAFVGSDGRYELHLRFAGMRPDTPVRVEAPDYVVEAPLSTLTSGVVTGP